MTQEEKAKAYDEALERAKKLHKDAITLQLEQDIKDYEYIFPELEKNRDERILEIINHCIESRYLHTSTIKGISQKECFAWLEKQSNTIPDECVFRPVAGCNIESAAKQAIKQQGVLAKEVVLAFNGAYIPVGGKAADIIVNEYNSWLEKQGESYTKRDVDDAYIEGMALAKNELEKQGKKKSPDEVLKIRQELYQSGYNDGYKHGCEDTKNQGEQKLANSAKTCKKSQRMVSAEAKEALYDKSAPIDIDKMVDDYANNEERGNEEFGKPVNCMVRAYRQGLNDAIEKVALKAAWSEEDETGWTNTMIMIKEVASHHYTKDSVKLVIDWLKSLKQRIGG